MNAYQQFWVSVFAWFTFAWFVILLVFFMGFERVVNQRIEKALYEIDKALRKK